MTDIIIRPLTEKDKQTMYRTLNSITMSDSVREHQKRYIKKAKHIRIGNIHKKLDI